MLQDAGEGDNLAASLVDAVADNLVDRVVGGGNILQGAVLVGLFHTQVLDVEAVVDLEVVAHMAHVEGVEACLRLGEGRLHLARLQHLTGVVGRHAQRLTAVDDILAKAQRQ